MKIGITQIILGAQALDETLKLCEAAGYEAVELTFREGKDLHSDLSDAELQDVGRKCADAGVEIASVIASGSAGGNLLSAADEDQKAGRERVTRSVEIANILGVDATLLHPGHLTVDGTYDDAWDRLRDALIELGPVAEKNGCAIGVENVWNRFMLSPREATQLVDEVGSEWVGVYLDTANMMAYGYPEQWIKALGSRIKKVHFKDFARRDHKFTDLLDGDTDWPAVVGELRAVGYDDAVIHEVGGDFDAQIETARRMRQIVAM